MDKSCGFTLEQSSPKSATFYSAKTYSYLFIPNHSRRATFVKLLCSFITKGRRNRYSVDTTQRNTLDVTGTRLDETESSPKSRQREFYKTNIGPGAYNIKYEAKKSSPKFSFGKSVKLKLKRNVAPGVGTYSPAHVPVDKAAPRCIIGRSSKCDKYWEKRMAEQSPGPVYSITSYEGVTSNHKLNNVV